MHERANDSSPQTQLDLDRVEVVDADLGDVAHARAIVDVLDSYASDPIGGGAPLRADVRERLVPALRKHPGSCVLLALAASAEPVGIAICFLGFSTFEARPLLNLHDLAVIPDARGRGIGRALLHAVEARARREDCCKLTLEVQDDNDRARHLYRSFGFVDFAIYGSSPTRFLSKPLRSE